MTDTNYSNSIIYNAVTKANTDNSICIEVIDYIYLPNIIIKKIKDMDGNVINNDDIVLDLGAGATPITGEAAEQVSNIANQENVTSLDGKTEVTDLGDDKATNTEQTNVNAENSPTGDGTEATEQTTTLEEGTELEFEGAVYKVDAKGNLVGADNKIFKAAGTELNNFLKQFDLGEADNETDATTGSVTIDAIQATLGVELTDEKGNPVTFENTPEGIAAYVNAVIEQKNNEVREAAINSLYEEAPVVRDFLNYIRLNNGDYTGFGQIPDRRGIVLDKDNVTQHEQVIRESFKEFNKPGVESYLKYLKDSGTTYEVAAEELKALQAKDTAGEQERQAQLAAKEQKEIEEAQKYWNGVKSIIDNRTIAGYKIPDTIMINKDGKSFTKTPDDFFDYISKVDKDGYTAYDRDCEKVSPIESQEDEILRAYLRFTGGSYSNLVDMAINAKEVKRLTLRNRSTTSKPKIRLTPKSSGKVNNDEILLDY